MSIIVTCYCLRPKAKDLGIIRELLFLVYVYWLQVLFYFQGFQASETVEQLLREESSYAAERAEAG